MRPVGPKGSDPGLRTLSAELNACAFALKSSVIQYGVVVRQFCCLNYWHNFRSIRAMRVALFYFCEHNLSKPSPGEQEGEWGEWKVTVTIRVNIRVAKNCLGGLDFESDGNPQGNPGSCHWPWSTRVKDAIYTLRYLAGNSVLFLFSFSVSFSV